MAEKGRPTKYREEFNEVAKKMCIQGLTDVQLAEALEVNPDTIYEWKKNYPKFAESLKEGKAIYDDQLVERALLKSATGFKRIVEKIDKDGCVHEVQEELAPNPTSLIFWLKNRQPAKWRDKQEVEHSGDINIAVNIIPKK
jgi:transposase-like protein